MTNYEVIERIEKTAVRIVVQWGNSLCEGSGVVISEDGKIATASHVIHNKLGQLAPEILVRKKGTGFKKYKPIIEFLKIDLPMMSEPIVIDLALLEPVSDGFTGDYLEINPSPKTGDEVFLAGFPQEMSLPFSFDKKLDSAQITMTSEAQFKMYDTGKQLLVKKAMIGYKSTVTINKDYKTELMYFDNGMSPGASGGPVVDENGLLMGINTSIGLMTFSDQQATFKAPTGTGIALNPNILLQLLEK